MSKKLKTVYLNDTEFNKLKPIETFPNKDVIHAKIANEIVRVHRTCLITIEAVKTDSEATWHNIDRSSFVGRSKDGFFPTDLIAGVLNGRYSTNTELSKQTGYQDSRNLGTASDAFTNLELVIKILKDNNFEIEIL